MVKQLIVVATPLFIYDTSKAIQCAQAILNFTILVQYILRNEETLCYMKHILYRLKKTKIAFE